MEPIGMKPEKRKLSEDKKRFIYSAIVSTSFIALIWLIFIMARIFNFDLTEFGVYPKTIDGLKGILFSPLIHSGFSHIFSNTIPLWLGFFCCIYFYRSSVYYTFWLVYILSGVMVWFAARPAYHIGASGLVYGLLSFLFFSGVIRRDKRSITLALLIAFLYGGMAWGVLPIDREISFEAHLSGAIIGIICAIFFRKTDPAPKYEWEEKEDDEDDYEYIPNENERIEQLIEEQNRQREIARSKNRE